MITNQSRKIGIKIKGLEGSAINIGIKIQSLHWLMLQSAGDNSYVAAATKSIPVVVGINGQPYSEISYRYNGALI